MTTTSFIIIASVIVIVADNSRLVVISLHVSISLRVSISIWVGISICFGICIGVNNGFGNAVVMVVITVNNRSPFSCGLRVITEMLDIHLKADTSLLLDQS